MAETLDLLLRNGHVIDPANQRDGVMDVGMRAGRVVRVAPRISEPATQTVDVTGLYVTPGLLDMHVHVYARRGEGGPTWQQSVIPDAHSFRSGVTTFVDAGSAGADDFADFKANWID